MAARRLIAVMLVLLFLSSLAAALAPVERQRDESSTTSTAEVFPERRSRGASWCTGSSLPTPRTRRGSRPRSVTSFSYG